MEYNKLYNGDCMELLKEIPSKSVDMVLTDVPYGVVNKKGNGLRETDKGKADLVTFDMEELLSELQRVTKGSIYIFCANEQISGIYEYWTGQDITTRLIVWEKTNPSPMNGQHMWLNGVECCVFARFPNATFNEFCKGNVLKFHSGKSEIHPTQKPLELFEYLMRVSSNEGDLVLDPFMGSGTTAVAAIRGGRRWIGFELDKEFYTRANDRINLEQSQLSLW